MKTFEIQLTVKLHINHHEEQFALQPMMVRALQDHARYLNTNKTGVQGQHIVPNLATITWQAKGFQNVE